MISFMVIPLIVIVAALIGSVMSKGGQLWYKALTLPSFTPPAWVFSVVWTVIYSLVAVSWIIALNECPCVAPYGLISILFLINLILNIGWSYLFFSCHMIATSVLEAIFLWLSVLILIMVLWPLSLVAALLLIPYAAWGFFAIYLDYQVWKLNKLERR